MGIVFWIKILKTIHSYYSNTPCQGRDCKFWGGEYIEEKIYPSGYNKDSGLYSKEEFTSVWHGEHCDKSCEIAILRKSIYDKALEASDNVHKSGKYKNINMECHKSGEEFDKIADEWLSMKCPFYKL
jgi:hypothetical protein